VAAFMAQLTSGGDPSNTTDIPWWGNPEGIDHIIYAYTGTTGKFYFDKVAKSVVDWGVLAKEAAKGDMDWPEFSRRYQLVNDADYEYFNFIYNKPMDVANYSAADDFYNKVEKIKAAVRETERKLTYSDKDEFSQSQYGVSYNDLIAANETLNIAYQEVRSMYNLRGSVNEIMYQAYNKESENQVVIPPADLNKFKGIVNKSEIQGVVFGLNGSNAADALKIFGFYNNADNRTSDKYSDLDIKYAQDNLNYVLNHRIDIVRNTALRNLQRTDWFKDIRFDRISTDR